MLNKNNKLRHSISLAAVLAMSGLSASVAVVTAGLAPVSLSPADPDD